MTIEEATAHVQTAAQELDRTYPEWPHRIDTGTLQLASCYQCIMGQLVAYLQYRSWAGFVTALAVGFERVRPAIFTHNSSDYLLLQDAWIAAIADRLVPVSAPADPVAVPVEV